MNMKKLTFTLGSISTIAIPLMTISCADDGTGSVNDLYVTRKVTFDTNIMYETWVGDNWYVENDGWSKEHGKTFGGFQVKYQTLKDDVVDFTEEEILNSFVFIVQENLGGGNMKNSYLYSNLKGFNDLVSNRHFREEFRQVFGDDEFNGLYVNEITNLIYEDAYTEEN